MPFGPGETGNRAGKPRGAKTRAPAVPINIARKSLRAVCARAAEGDEQAQALVVRYDGITRAPVVAALGAD